MALQDERFYKPKPKVRPSPFDTNADTFKPDPAIAPDDIESHINGLIDEPLKSAVGMRLQNLLAQYPKQEDFKPSKTRRVVGGILGGALGASDGPDAGAKLATDTIDAPYNSALGKWESQYKPLQTQFGLEQTASKNRADSLSNIASLKRAIDEGDVNLQSQLAYGKAAGAEKATQPGRLQLRNLEDENAMDRTKVVQAGETSRNESSNQNRIDTTGMTVTGENDRLNTKNWWESRENALDRKSRELIASKERALRRELADKEIGSRDKRIPVDQQVKSYYEAENRILTGRSEDPVLRVTTKELNNIADVVKDTKGNVVGYSLKPLSSIPKEWQPAWKTRKSQIDLEHNKIINDSFTPGQDSSMNGASLDSDWSTPTLKVK